MDGGLQMFAHQSNRLLGEHISKRVSALIRGALSGWQRKHLIVDRSEGLNRMRQGIDSTVGCHLGWAREGQFWIDQRHLRAQPLAQDAQFHLLLHIREHRRTGDLGPGSRGRRQADQRQNGARNPVFSHVVAGMPAV